MVGVFQLEIGLLTGAQILVQVYGAEKDVSENTLAWIQVNHGGRTTTYSIN